MSMPKTAVTFALKHKLSLGRDSNGFFLKVEGVVVERSNENTAKSACAMMRRFLRQRAAEASRVASRTALLAANWPTTFGKK